MLLEASICDVHVTVDGIMELERGLVSWGVMALDSLGKLLRGLGRLRAC